MQDLYHRARARKAIAALALLALRSLGVGGLLWASTAQGQQYRSPMAGLPGDGLPAVLDLLNRPSPPPVTIVDFDAGGRIQEYDLRWRSIAGQGGQVAVLGMCQSACTLVVAHIPRGRLCFGNYSSLNFHQARLDDGSPAPRATQWMTDRYPQDIRDWLTARGGPEAMPRYGYWVLPAEKLWAMGYRKCD